MSRNSLDLISASSV